MIVQKQEGAWDINGIVDFLLWQKDVKPAPLIVVQRVSVRFQIQMPS